MRRAVVVVVCVVVAGAFVTRVGVGHSAVQSTQTSPETLVDHLLHTQAASLMTGAARRALEALGGQAASARVSEAERQRLAQLQPATGGASSAAVAPALVANVRVNEPAQDTAQIDQTTQSETSVAVAGSNVAVGFNDSQQGLLVPTAAADLSGYAYSSNGGASFTDGGTLPNRPGLINAGDPWLASDRTGAIYYASLALDFVNHGLQVVVGKSSDGAKTWTTPVAIAIPGTQADKDALAVGPDPAVRTRDNLYAAWDDFACVPNGPQPPSCFAGLPLARSLDGGTTWQLTYLDRIPLSLTSCSFKQYIGAQPLVNPANGKLWVAAEKIVIDDPNCTGGTLRLSEVIFASGDGGQSFGPATKIADVTAATPLGALELAPGQDMRTIEFPSLALVGHTLYAAWNDGRKGPSHIRLAHSSDGGATWSASFVTSGTGDELQPALSADAKGLHLAYYARNANNTLDVLEATSTDGTAFTTRRVTSTSFPGVFTAPQFDPIIAQTYMGDYIANVSDGSHQYLAWGDNRDQVVSALWPAGRNDPNLYFGRT